MLAIRRQWLFWVVATLFAVGALAETSSAAESGSYLVTRDVFYGDSERPDRELQSLDVFWIDNLKRRPVIIYLHDGAWALGTKADVNKKPGFFSLHDMAFVSMNYRLRWEASLNDQLDDVVSVIRWVGDNADQYGLDPKRIVLMGHGAGAHLAALVATQPAFLDTGEIDFAHVRAVVGIDSASYDIGALMADEATAYLDKRRHRLIFGEEAQGWRTASPITHLAEGKTIPPFALLYVPGNNSTASQARHFAKALRESDIDVIMIPGNEKTTETIDDEIGSARDAPTLALITFLRAAI